MKTKLSLVLAIVVIATAAFAKSEPSIAVVAGSEKHIFKVVYKSEKSNKVQVTIFNSDREIVFDETINNKDSFSRPYNFSAMPSGEYTIEVKDNSGKKIEKVSYNQNTLVSTMSVKKLDNETSKYLITSVTNGLNIINVSVYDADGNLLHSESHVVDGSFGVVYNLTKQGNYSFVLTDGAGVSSTFNF